MNSHIDTEFFWSLVNFRTALDVLVLTSSGLCVGRWTAVIMLFSYVIGRMEQRYQEKNRKVHAD